LEADVLPRDEVLRTKYLAADWENMRIKFDYGHASYQALDTETRDWLNNKILIPT
jgi:hypothetical protein